MAEPSFPPARGYSWKPFEPGHTISLRHGARSARVLQPIADQLLAEVGTVAPWTGRPAFAAELAAWAWAEARCQVLRSWIDGHAILSDEGLLAAGELARAESRAANARDRLGLNPLALSRLLATLASVSGAGTDDGALEQLKAEGRAIVEARGTALAAGPDPNTDQEETP